MTDLTRADVVLRRPERRGIDERRLEVKATGETIAVIVKDSWGSAHCYDIYVGEEQTSRGYVGHRTELESAIEWVLGHYKSS